MKMYISGRISGLPSDQVSAKFEQAEQQVIAAGHTPVSPLKNGLPGDAPWSEHMGRDITMLLESDAVYRLADWADSQGARIEHAAAVEYGMAILDQPDYAAYKPQ